MGLHVILHGVQHLILENVFRVKVNFIGYNNILKDDVAIYYVGKRKNGNGYVKEMKLTDTGLFEEPTIPAIYPAIDEKINEIIMIKKIIIKVNK